MTKSTLKTALPTMVPKPTVDRLNVPTNDVASSGADPPAAMSVAPATAAAELPLSAMTSSAGTKSSSQMIAMARKRYSTPTMQPTVTPHPRFLPQSSAGEPARPHRPPPRPTTAPARRRPAPAAHRSPRGSPCRRRRRRWPSRRPCAAAHLPAATWAAGGASRRESAGKEPGVNTLELLILFTNLALRV